MTKKRLILPVEISYLRMTAQLLLPSLHKQSVTEVVDHMLAMQGQQVYSLPHAVLVRTNDAHFSDVKMAFEQRLLVRHRPMRGTVHVTCAKDYHWLRLTLNQKPSSYILREEALAGISASIFTEAAQIAWEAIAESEDWGIGRKELFTQWIQHFQNMMTGKVSETQFCNLLMWGLDRSGLLVEGPLRKNQHLFIDGRSLPAADSMESGFCLDQNTPKTEALAEVAYRYARGHGPISIADLARWASLSKRIAKAALDSNVERGRLNRYQITETGLKDYDSRCNSNNVYYMQPELPDMLDRYRNEIAQILFLPSFDELHVGYENRTCLADEVGETAICPAKNGMFKPIVIQNGRLIAVFPKDGINWLKPADLKLKNAVDEVIQGVQARMDTKT